MNKYEEAKRLLKKYNQEELLKEVEKNKKEELIEQILQLDFERIEKAKRKIEEKENFKEDKIERIAYVDLEQLSKEEKENYEQIGSSIIKQGKYAVVTMAGGQGTRLGHEGPKGTFKLDVYGKGKYIFEILTETLKEANKKVILKFKCLHFY